MGEMEGEDGSGETQIMTGSGMGGGLGGLKIGESEFGGMGMGRGPLTGEMVGRPEAGGGVEKKSCVKIWV